MAPETKAFFDVDWLSLREPVDHRSRAETLLPHLEAASNAHRWSRVLDLGSGTGSNLRYLAPRLPRSHDWTLVDYDSALLNHPVHVNLRAQVRSVRRVHRDLTAHDLPEVGQANLVTGSALLDLVSQDWLKRLVQACQKTGCDAYFALNYDGDIRWFSGGLHSGDLRPDDVPDDELIRTAVNAHQRGDKGFGPALGPTAGIIADRLFKAAGYRTWLSPSPWWLGPQDHQLVDRLINGWKEASLEVDYDPVHTDRIKAWVEHRRQTVNNGSFTLRVGHQDLVAVLPSPNPASPKPRDEE